MHPPWPTLKAVLVQWNSTPIQITNQNQIIQGIKIEWKTQIIEACHGNPLAPSEIIQNGHTLQNWPLEVPRKLGYINDKIKELFVDDLKHETRAKNMLTSNSRISETTIN